MGVCRVAGAPDALAAALRRLPSHGSWTKPMPTSSASIWVTDTSLWITVMSTPCASI